MPNKFDFAFVQSKNIGLKYFPVSQATVTFTVSGAEDELTLQQMRDAVHPKFLETQKKINDFIASRSVQVQRLGVNERRQKKDEQLIDAGNQSIQRFLGEFKKAADGELAAYVRAQEAKNAKIAESPGTAATGVKWLVSLGWTMYQGAKAVADMWGAEGPLKIYDGIKGFLDALNDLKELVVKFQDFFATEKTANAKVRAALKAMAGKKTFTEGDVKALEDAVNLYETKVLGMEMTSKSLSGKVTRAIAAVPANGIKPEAQKEAEVRLDHLLKALIKLQESLKPVEKQLKTYKINLGAAKAFVKKEKATGWGSWLASKGYEFKDAIWAAWEGKFDELADELTDKGIDFLIKTFSVPENVIRPI